MLQNNILTLDNGTFEVFLPEAEILNRLKIMASEIERDLAGKQPIFICVMNGALIFFTDLIREIKTIDLETESIRLSSYGNSEVSSGQVQVLQSIKTPLTGRDIVIVEDIIDSGRSMKFLRELLLKENPASLRIATLLWKQTSAHIDFPIDYIGFTIPDHFVIGYGLDYKQVKRNLKSIYIKK